MTERPSRPSAGLLKFGHLEKSLEDIIDTLEDFLDLCGKYQEAGNGFPVDRASKYEMAVYDQIVDLLYGRAYFEYLNGLEE